MAGGDRRYRGGRPPQRVLGDFAGMCVAGRLAGDGAQPEAQAGVKIRGTDMAVVEADRLAFSILQEQFAVVAALQRLLDDGGGGGLIQSGIGPLEEQLVSGCDGAHGGNPSWCGSTD